MFTYSLGYHAFGVGYQKMSGDTGFAYINGADPYLVNFIQIGDFANKDEKSWQARYDYNFAGVGIPGLTFMTRYLHGDHVRLAGVTETAANGDARASWATRCRAAPSSVSTSAGATPASAATGAAIPASTRTG